MKFYKEQHKYYCGIDLHARKMFVSLWLVCLHHRMVTRCMSKNPLINQLIFIDACPPWAGLVQTR